MNPPDLVLDLCRRAVVHLRCARNEHPAPEAEPPALEFRAVSSRCTSRSTLTRPRCVPAPPPPSRRGSSPLCVARWPRSWPPVGRPVQVSGGGARAGRPDGSAAAAGQCRAAGRRCRRVTRRPVASEARRGFRRGQVRWGQAATHTHTHVTCWIGGVILVPFTARMFWLGLDVKCILLTYPFLSICMMIPVES